MTRIYIAFVCLFLAEPAFARQTYSDAIAAIRGGEYGQVHSLLISKDGELIVEEYFNGWTADSLHQLQSATKSVVSTLMGIAIHKGFISGVDAPVVPFFDDRELENMDDRKRAMTIEDLLTQRHGLAWNEGAWEDPENTWRKVLATEGDWYGMILGMPMQDDPGTGMAYSNAAPLLTTGVIQQASGMDIQDFAAEHLFAPLGITSWRFWQGNGGPEHNGAALLFLRPRDMIKIGQLYLQDGIWDGERLLPEGWVEEAAATPVVPAYEDNPHYLFGYGYFWWNTPRPRRFGLLPVAPSVFVARGAGGQYIVVHPEERMVVVLTAWDLQFANLLFEVFPRYLQADRYRRF